MDENFHQSKKLSKDQLKVLMQRNDNPAIARFVFMLLLFWGTCVWVVYSWNGALWNFVLAQFSFGIMCCSIFASLHETAHNTAFKSKILNKWAASIAGMLHLYPSIAFREMHFTHHRHTHIPGLDPEISLGNKPLPSIIGKLPTYLSWLTGIPFLLFKISMILSGAIGMPEFFRKEIFPFVQPELRKRLMLECNIILSFHLFLLFLAIYVYTGFWGLFLGQIVGHCLLASYLVIEHNGLPYEGDILEKTRSIRTNKLVKLLMWNMPYHAEHHAYPAIPFHALPKLHEELIDELKHKHEGHSDFHLKVLSNLIKGN